MRRSLQGKEKKGQESLRKQ